MSRDVEVLVNNRVIGEGQIKEGGKAIKISGVYRKAALMQFANRADDDGAGIWVSILRVSVWIECNERHGRRVLRSLEEDGLVVDTGQVKVMENGVVMPIYDVVLSAVRKLPQARDALEKKAKAKLDKNQRDTQSRRDRRATVARQDSDDDRDTVARSRASVARNRATVAAKEETYGPEKGLGSKEPKPESVNGHNGHDHRGGFALTPNAGEPKQPKRGVKTVLPMKEPETVVEFYEKFRDSDFFGAIPAAARARTQRQPSISALTVMLGKHDRDHVAMAIRNYYKAEVLSRRGENARGLQNLIIDGTLEDLIREVARKRKPANPANDDEPLSLDDAIKRLRASKWRDTWGDSSDQIYDEARAAMAARN